MKRLYTWQGKLYGVLFDADAQILYYRKDVLGNADYQEKFKSKLGYDLPNPPKTMKEMHDVASFLPDGIGTETARTIGEFLSMRSRTNRASSIFLPSRLLMSFHRITNIST